MEQKETILQSTTMEQLTEAEWLYSKLVETCIINFITPHQLQYTIWYVTKKKSLLINVI